MGATFSLLLSSGLSDVSICELQPPSLPWKARDSSSDSEPESAACEEVRRLRLLREVKDVEREKVVPRRVDGGVVVVVVLHESEALPSPPLLLLL